MTRPTYENFDFRAPDYVSVFKWRAEFLQRIRADPRAIAAVKAHYRNAPWDFINDWGVTYDPRNIAEGKPAVMPFILFKRQIECVEWVMERLRNGEPGLIEKSRDVGLSWLTVAIGCSLCVLGESVTIGFGSRKEEYVDKVGHPKSLFWKARMFMKYLPAEFRGGWVDGGDAHMRVGFSATGSVMTGEAGDNIGRGDRTMMHFVDESAHLQRAELIEASLSATTNCRIDLSSVNGMNNVFAQKRHSGKVPVFVFDWRDDPRKDDEWYKRQCEILPFVTVKQEIDRDYLASNEGQIIEGPWIQAAIDAHIKLGIEPTGERVAGLDIADEGTDKNALAFRHGILLTGYEAWSGQGSDIYNTTARAFEECGKRGIALVRYETDGLGAGVRGDANVINAAREGKVEFEAWRAAGPVVDPEAYIIKGIKPKPGDIIPKNKDHYANAKAQAWFHLRALFENTYKAVQAKKAGIEYKFDPDEIIALDGKMKGLTQLISELSQPVRGQTSTGKIVVEKSPSGMASPNAADSVMIAWAPKPKKRASFLTARVA